MNNDPVASEFDDDEWDVLSITGRRADVDRIKFPAIAIRGSYIMVNEKMLSMFCGKSCNSVIVMLKKDFSSIGLKFVNGEDHSHSVRLTGKKKNFIQCVRVTEKLKHLKGKHFRGVLNRSGAFVECKLDNPISVEEETADE